MAGFIGAVTAFGIKSGLFGQIVKIVGGRLIDSTRNTPTDNSSGNGPRNRHPASSSSALPAAPIVAPSSVPVAQSEVLPLSGPASINREPILIADQTDEKPHVTSAKK